MSKLLEDWRSILYRTARITKEPTWDNKVISGRGAAKSNAANIAGSRFSELLEGMWESQMPTNYFTQSYFVHFITFIESNESGLYWRTKQKLSLLNIVLFATSKNRNTSSNLIKVNIVGRHIILRRPSIKTTTGVIQISLMSCRYKEFL